MTRQKRGRGPSSSNTLPQKRQSSEEIPEPEPKKPIKRARPVSNHPRSVKAPAAVVLEPTVEPELHQEAPGALYTFGANVCCQLGLIPEPGKFIDKRKFPALVKTFHDDKIDIRFVAAGGMHTVALANDGRVYTFGSNDEGALGRPIDEDNEEVETSRPSLVQLPAKAKFITAGSSHSAALLEDGSVHCWGTFRDGSGYFGLTSRDDKEGESLLHRSPVQLDLNIQIKSIASGNDHMVLLTKNGKVLTFGACMEVLGRKPPTRETRRTVNRSRKEFMLTPSEPQFSRSKKFSNIWAGSSATFCKESNKTGTIWAFGMNSQKQLGIDLAVPYIELPTKAVALSKYGFTQIAIGEFHCLGLSQDGKVYSWGKSQEGQLGLGPGTLVESIATPQHVSSLSRKVVAIACGHSVSYALTEESTLYAWGFGENWQLGYGEDEDRNVPTPVLAKIRGEAAGSIRFIAGGGQHACLIGDFGLGMAMDTS